MGVLVHEKPCSVQGQIRLEPAASRGGDGSRCLIRLIKGCTGCESKIDRVHWNMVPWPTLERERLTADVAPLGVLMLPLEVLTSRGWFRCKGDVVCDPASATFHLHCILFLCSCDFEAFEDDFVASSPYVPENPRDCVVNFRPALRKYIGRTDEVLFLYLHSEDMIWVLEISDYFGAFWRYLEQAPEMTIEIDNRSILES
ncbi:hypothetical protein F2Q69_00054765 [Brassica cretica]|uniref:Uncharacterized protein n=1 Tax=Brassica cretica TaxID=69181 RepID=A0A8S9N3E4_BRACR|nr:hypothetical protein F2Q69_00054765 [Brassica cretica]